jgi:hypothetical protein
MNPKTTRLWILVAAGLFAFIFFYQRHARKPAAGPIKPLPQLQAAAITSIQVRTQGEAQITAILTNRIWQLTEPIADLANGSAIESFFHALEQLSAATYIPARELRDPAKADEEFGFVPDNISLLLQQGDQKLPQLKIGRKTNPGDQVFLQVAGDQGVYVVDAAWLAEIPRTANAWRDPRFINLTNLVFDRIGVTNSGASFVLQRDPDRVWRMVFPIKSRADNSRIQDALTRLHFLRVSQFVTNRLKPELEAFGLAPADLEVGLNLAATNVALLQFGKTNEAGQVYARRAGRNAVFTLPAEMLAQWQHAAVNDFRDRRLLSLPADVAALEIRAEDNFALHRQTNGAWRLLPQNFPADAGLVGELLSNLTNMPIVDFPQDVVTAPVLPTYGLAAPLSQYLVFGPGFRADATNGLLADLSFGTNQAGKVFARRADEEPIYAVSTNDVARLPVASWQMRQRRFWTFSPNDIAGVSIRHLGKNRRITRRDAYKWSLAPGFNGIINDVAIEETIRGLAEVEAVAWAARGAQNRARFGFKDDGHQITLELKNGEKVSVEFGGEAPSSRQYAAVTLAGDVWIFEFPAALYRHVLGYLTIPANVP